MRAFIASASGGLRLTDRERPTPGPGEVLIDVSAIALNRGESRRAVQGGVAEGTVPGWDTAGVISKIGPGTDAPPIGTRVVARALSGGWAESRVAHRDDIAVIPDAVEMGMAATLATAATTALAVLTRDGPILGQTVLITGATGSVGRFAVQLARHGGARVIAVARSDKARADLEALGAHEVLVGLERAPQADLVVESLGGTSLVRAAALLRPGGRLQSIGWSSGEDAVFSGFDALMKSGGTLRGFAIGERRVGGLLDQLLPLLRDGKLKPCIQSRQAWDQLPDAAAAVLKPGFSGKAVLDVSRSRAP